MACHQQQTLQQNLGERVTARSARSDRRFRLPIATPSLGVLRRPPESTQYASEPYRAVLERHGITQSMSRRCNCLDCEYVGAAWGV